MWIEDQNELGVSALPVHYLLEIYEGSHFNDVVAHFQSSAPFMSFHVGELFEPRGLIRDVYVPAGHYWKITKVLHRVWEIEESHITHQIAICVATVPQPESETARADDCEFKNERRR